MGKDRSPHRKVCMRCDHWAEDGSELCAGCEQNVLEEMAFEKRAQDVGPLIASWNWWNALTPDEQHGEKHGPGSAGCDECGIGFGYEQPSTVVMDKDVQSTPTEYEDPLDQARADSLEGGE